MDEGADELAADGGRRGSVAKRNCITSRAHKTIASFFERTTLAREPKIEGILAARPLAVITALRGTLIASGKESSHENLGLQSKLDETGIVKTMYGGGPARCCWKYSIPRSSRYQQSIF